MAVTVEEQAPFVVLDTGDKIVEVGPGAQDQFGPLLGSVLWDSFPDSQPLFKPYYDKARRTGEPVEFVQFYDGNVARIWAVPGSDHRLELYWELIVRLDTLTLGGLAKTLDESLELLDDATAARDQLRQTLRVIQGGR